MTATTDGDTNTLSISAALKAQEVSVINISCGDTVYLTSSYDLNQVIFGILATTGYIDYDPSQETTGGSGEGELSKADGVEIDVIEKSSGLRECLTDDDSFTGANLFNLAMKSQTANIYSLYRDGKELVRVELTAMKVESDTGTGRSLQINKLSLPGDCTITYNLNGGSLASGGSTTSLRGNGDKIAIRISIRRRHFFFLRFHWLVYSGKRRERSVFDGNRNRKHDALRTLCVYACLFRNL